MSYKIYGPENYERFFKRRAESLKIKSGFAIEHVPNGIIALDEKSIGYGVFDQSGRFVKSSTQLRHKKGQFIPKSPAGRDDIKYCDADAVYMGSLESHFGHFLLEHMDRCYAFLREKYRGMKCVFVNNKRTEVSDFVYVLLELLGIDRRDIVMLDETTKFKNVYVPQQSLNIPTMTSREVRDIYNVISANAADGESYDKIYLSRSLLKRRRVFGEAQIEKIFEKNGYKVIHPETLPMEKQVAVMKNCKSLAGCAGSALHNALFMPDGGEVIQIKRNTVASRDNAYVQYMVNAPKNLDLVLVSGSVEEYKTDHFVETPQIIGVTKYMRRFFDDRGFEYSADDVAPDAAELDEYRNALSKYLKENPGNFMKKAKGGFIKIVSCFVPGRRNRRLFRQWLKLSL